MAPKEKRFPSSLCMGTFRKSLFILYSRRPGGRLLINREKTGIIAKNTLITTRRVKGKNGKNAFGNSLGSRFELRICS